MADTPSCRLCCHHVWWHTCRRVQAAIAEGRQQGAGSVRQALCAALSEEVTDFYRLMAVLEAQLAVPQPLPGGRAQEPHIAASQEAAVTIGMLYSGSRPLSFTCACGNTRAVPECVFCSASASKSSVHTLHRDAHAHAYLQSGCCLCLLVVLAPTPACRVHQATATTPLSCICRW